MFSKKHLTAAFVSAILCGTSGSTAFAIGLAPPFIEYAAKFACGLQTADADVVAGTYATSINIHNPQSTIVVSFLKKFVIANEEGATAGRIVQKQDRLAPDSAERVDCPLIEKLLGSTASAHIEGFIVIEVAPIPSAAGPSFQPVLDVVGKYSARSTAATSSVTSFSVTPYAAKSITE